MSDRNWKERGFLKGATATPFGFVSAKGEMLKRVRLTPREIMDFNDWGDDMIPKDCEAHKPAKKVEVKVEEAVAVEVTEEELPCCDCEDCGPDCDCDCGCHE